MPVTSQEFSFKVGDLAFRRDRLSLFDRMTCEPVILIEMIPAQGLFLRRWRVWSPFNCDIKEQSETSLIHELEVKTYEIKKW